MFKLAHKQHFTDTAQPFIVAWNKLYFQKLGADGSTELSNQ
jgi:hypothetical protein